MPSEYPDVGWKPSKEPEKPKKEIPHFDIADMIRLVALQYEIKKYTTTAAQLSVWGSVKNEYPATPRGYIKVLFLPDTGDLVSKKVPMTYYPGRELQFDVDLFIPIVRGKVSGELIVQMAPFDYSRPKEIYRKRLSYTYDELERPHTRYEDVYGNEREDSPGRAQDEKKEPEKSNYFLYIGLGLIIAGALIYILRRR